MTPSARMVGAWIGALTLGVAAVLWPLLVPVALTAVLVLVGLTAADAWSLARRPPLVLERELPERAWCGRPAELISHIRNPSKVSVRASLFEALPLDLGGSEKPVSVEIGAGQPAQVRSLLRPRVRGNRGLGTAILLEAGRLGLVRRRVSGTSGQHLRVYPDTHAFLGRDALDPKHLRATLGIRPARRRGEGSEFESLREYAPGDDPRRIDWAASARRARPIVRQYRHERNHTVWIAIDASRLMAGRDAEGGRTKLDAAIDAALALSHAAVASGDRVGLTVFDREVRAQLAPRRARRDLGEFVEILTDIHPAIVEADFRALVRQLGVRQRGRALVVILTDFAETETGSFLGPLAVLGKQHRVLLVALRDRIFDPREAPAGDTRDPALESYRRIVVDDLQTERDTALLGLRRRGLQTLDLPPAAITGAVLNRYLEMREAR